jgi:hypothetical protein
MLNQLSFPIVLSLRLVRNPSAFSVIPSAKGGCSESFFKEGFPASGNDELDEGFWTDPR